MCLVCLIIPWCAMHASLTTLARSGATSSVSALDMGSVPSELRCPLSGRILRDAASTPCCNKVDEGETDGMPWGGMKCKAMNTLCNDAPPLKCMCRCLRRSSAMPVSEITSSGRRNSNAPCVTRLASLLMR